MAASDLKTLKKNGAWTAGPGWPGFSHLGDTVKWRDTQTGAQPVHRPLPYERPGHSGHSGHYKNKYNIFNKIDRNNYGPETPFVARLARSGVRFCVVCRQKRGI